MHKVNELSQDFLKSWKIGWPEYISLPEQDSKPILELAEKCARVARVELDEEAGFNRVLSAVASIASFCSKSVNWRTNNLHQINKALQSILLEMMADKKTRQEAEYAQSAADRSTIYAQQERARVEKEMEESRKKAKYWYENEMTAEEKADYEAWKKKVEIGRVIYMDLAKQKSVNKAL